MMLSYDSQWEDEYLLVLLLKNTVIILFKKNKKY